MSHNSGENSVILVTPSYQVYRHSRLRCLDSTRVGVSRCLYGVSFCIQNLLGEDLLYPNQLNLNKFLEAGPWPSSPVKSLSCVRLLVTLWTAACQASLSITNSRSLLKLMSIESGMPSNHLILCRPLLLLPSVFPSIRVFSDESVLCIIWTKYWSFSFSISPSN